MSKGGVYGGLSELQSIALAEKVKRIVAQMKDAVSAKTGKTYTTFKAVSFRTQLVAGTNYFIKVDVGNGKYIHIRVFEPLPIMELDGVQVGKTLDDEIKYFD